MSFEQNYGTYFQPYNHDDGEESIFTKEELLEHQIEEQLEFEEMELEEIKLADPNRRDKP